MTAWAVVANRTTGAVELVPQTDVAAKTADGDYIPVTTDDVVTAYIRACDWPPGMFRPPDGLLTMTALIEWEHRRGHR